MIDILADEREKADLSTGDAVGITFTITLLVALPVGVVTGLVVAWWDMARVPLVRVHSRRQSSSCGELSMRSLWRLPYLSVTTWPMAMLI